MKRPRDGGASLAQLAHALGARLSGARPSKDGELRVAGVHHDSRRIEPGDLFVALAGRQLDGLAFVPQALSRGAAAVVVSTGRAKGELAVPRLEVADARLALAQAAALIYGDPARELVVLGVTGTNGKTTTVELVRAALLAAGERPAVMGTLGARFGETVIDSRFNTPEADELARIAAWMREQGASHLLMEVTSHALAEKRVDGMRFRVAAFSNLTRDHLDLHPSMAAYGAAKARLFIELAPETAALMVDDPFGVELAARVRAKLPVAELLRVSGQPDARADVRPVAPPVLDADGVGCEVTTPTGLVALASPLLGRYNLANLLLSLGVCIAFGLEPQRAADAFGSCPSVPGRLQRCDEPADEVMAFVDYAHTPDALEQVLRTVRALTPARLICVFGCGGDRDRRKRPLMGEVAGRGADRVVLTNDNPRSEDPQAIVDEVCEGLEGQPADTVVELDRARAITLAVETLEPGDALIVAGKGHERVQVVGTEERPFDDCEVLREALARRRAVRGMG